MISRRWMMRIWFGLSLIVFGSRYAEDIRDYFFPRPSAGAEAPPQTAGSDREGLRLASWNLEFLDVLGHGRAARGKNDLAALRRYAERIDADVIAVQEVASTEALAAVFPPDRYSYHLAHTGGSQHTGFAYLKTLDVDLHPEVTGLAVGHLRGGTDMSVRFQGRELRILSVHLKAYCGRGPLDPKDRDCNKLRAQLPALEAWIDARAREGVAYAVVGDFNRALAEPGDPVYAEIDDGDPAGLRLKRASMRTRTRCRGGRAQPAIDHIVLGGSAIEWLPLNGFVELSYDPGDVNGYHLSDHCPISVTLAPPKNSPAR